MLARYFVGHYTRRVGKDIHHITTDAMQKLLEYTWPGNVRELNNIIERAVILCDGNTLKADHMD